MKRQGAIFVVASLLIAVLGLTFTSRAVADLTLLYATTVDVAGVQVTLRPSTTPAEEYYLVLQESQEVVSKRLENLLLTDQYGVTTQDDELIITLPDQGSLPHIITMVTRVGEVTFIDGGERLPPLGQKIETVSARDAAQSGSAADYPVLFTGREIITIVPPADTGDIFYQIQLGPAAANRVSRFVNVQPQSYVCLVIDKQVINCSKMYYFAEDTLDILPNLSNKSGFNLADVAIFLHSGPLPVSLKVVTN